MRKWSFILFCLTALIGIVVLVGCEGDTGVTGGKGAKGRQGTPGYDPDRLAPADRVFMFAVTNKSEVDASGKKQLFLTFDSTAKASKDTVVANRVSVPPLIDGLDGEEYEWGAQKSKMPLTFLSTDPNGKDAKLKNGVVRVAYDDDNIYFQFQWQEQSVRDVASVGESAELNELIFFGRGRYADGSQIGQWEWVKRYSCQNDSIRVRVFPRIRVRYTPDCLIPGDTCECWDLRSTRVAPETTLVWAPREGSAEDRLVVFFPREEVSGWKDASLNAFFGWDPAKTEIPNDLFVDVWAWGAARTNSVGVADDWVIDATGARADAGQAPYISNWSPIDSIPLFMNRRDPNLRTSEPARQTAAIYPLWYFDAVRYKHFNWALGTDSVSASSLGQRIDCSLPGIIAVIPTDSRADVYAAARFDNSGGYWTVEMKRARRTHNIDDVQF